MKILNIKPYNFKSDFRVFAYDDEMSQAKRRYIRNHIEAQLFPP